VSTPAEAALRASAPEAYTVLDDEDRIVHLSAPYRDTRGRSIGHVFWDHLPHAREVYEPHFAEARSTGRAVEAVVFYAGRLGRVGQGDRPLGIVFRVQRRRWGEINDPTHCGRNRPGRFPSGIAWEGTRGFRQDLRGSIDCRAMLFLLAVTVGLIAP